MGRGLGRILDPIGTTRGCNPLQPARSKSLLGPLGTVCVSIMGRSTIGGGQRVQYHGQKYDRGGGKLQYYALKCGQSGEKVALLFPEIEWGAVFFSKGFHNVSLWMFLSALQFCALRLDAASGSAHVAAGQSVRRPRGSGVWVKGAGVQGKKGSSSIRGTQGGGGWG